MLDRFYCRKACGFAAHSFFIAPIMSILPIMFSFYRSFQKPSPTPNLGILMENRVYLSIGSNLGDSVTLVQQALQAIEEIPHIHTMQTSQLYRTSPVSPLFQRDFINAACAFYTTLTPHQLYDALHQIEIALGKKPKPKNHPRLIDIDILLFGSYFHCTEELCIPHPHWKERLFVLIPLLDLTEQITFPVDAEGTRDTLYLKKYLTHFQHDQRVLLLDLNSVKVPSLCL